MSDIPDPIQSEGSSDSFQSFLARALAGDPVDLPDVAAPEAPAGSPFKGDGVPGSETQSQSDTGAGRDGGPGQQQVNIVAISSHHSSAGGTCSDTPPSEMHVEGRGRGRGRGRRAKRSSGQETAQQRAHRRFYERKKQKLAALEQAAAEKLALYHRLQRENAELKRKYEALTCVIAGREQQMTLLEAMGSLCINPTGSQPAISQDAAAAGAANLELLLQQQEVQSGQLPTSAMLSMHRRRDSAPTALWPAQQQQQQQPPKQLLRHIAATGPFGRVQLQAQDSPAAVVQPFTWQQPVCGPEQLLPHPWSEQQGQIQPMQEQPPQQQPMQLHHQHFMLQQQQQQPGLNIQRSTSMPAPAPVRPSPSDPGSSSAAAAAGQPSFVMGPNMPRAYSSSPHTWHGSAVYGQQLPQLLQQQQQQVPQAWTAGPSRLQQATSSELQQQLQSQQFAPQQQQQQQQQQFAPQQFAPQQQQQQGPSSRPHSWSGHASPNSMSMAAPPAIQRSSQSFPSASPPALHSSAVGSASPPQQPYLLQQQFLAGPEAVEAAAVGGALLVSWQQQQQRRGFTITTAGPVMALQQQHYHHQQQQQQQMHRSGSDPTAAVSSRHQLMAQQQQQWQQQQLQGFSVQQQQQPELQLPQFALPDLPPVQQQYCQQQQQQQQDPAAAAAAGGLDDFGSLVPLPADDLMMLDNELMMLLDRELSSQQGLPQQQQQQAPNAAAAAEGNVSGDLLSSLQSIPSAGAELAAAAAGGMPIPQQQQQQEAAAGSPPETLLMASRRLQARHEAAGYFPAAAAAASGEADFVYVHQVVEWYRSKLQSLSELLPRVDRPLPDVAAGLALVQVVEQLLMGVRKFSTRNRVGLWELKLINLETGDFEEAPANYWRDLLHRITFSREAREKLDGCFSLYKDHVAKARDERQEVLQEMAALTAELHGSDDGSNSATKVNVTDQAAGPLAAAVAGMGAGSSSGFGLQQQQGEAPRSLQFRNDGLDRWQEVLEKLQVSLQREHMVANMIMYSCAQAATHVQMAKAMLHSWPYWPNGYCMLTILHEEEQLAAAAAAAGRPVWPEPVSRMRSI